MRGLSILLAAGLIIAVCGCETEGPEQEWSGLVHPDVLKKADLQYYWRYTVPLEPGETILQMRQAR